MRIGYAVCGSFCTHKYVIPAMKELILKGHEIIPVLSEITAHTDTRFGKAEDFIEAISKLTGHEPIVSVRDAEKIGPGKLTDIMIVAPCTGNTLAKLANGITDTSVTMAAKANLRNMKPLLLAVATNDALSASAQNIGRLMNTKNVYFVPMSQDDAVNKPTSVIAEFAMIPEAVDAALNGKQMMPVYVPKDGEK